MDLKTAEKMNAHPVIFLRKEADKPIMKITTETGEEITLSSDHPIFDGNVFKEAGEVKECDTIVIHPFLGVRYEEPSDGIILDEDDIIKLVGNRKKLIKELKNNGLLPLRYNSKKLPILAKLVGFITGDGWVGEYYSKKRKMGIWSSRIIGKSEDLEEIKKDIKELGYDANYTKTATYRSQITYSDGKKIEVCGDSTQLFLVSQSLSVLLHALGVPKGNKSRNPTKVPEWIKRSPLWIKRLYIAGLFGAELSKPAQKKSELHCFIEPNFSQNKINGLEKENLNFMLDIINLLLEFGVVTNKIYRQKGTINRRGEETHKLALRISSKSENLIRLWSQIGYEYSKERTNLSMLAVSYINYKKMRIKKLNEKIRIPAGLAGSSKPREMTRIPRNFETFAEFSQNRKIQNSPFILDKVLDVKKIDYNGYVYDFTMADANHNFIANCVVTHNCGMRLVRSRLTYDEVKPKLKELVDMLFKRVPAGVGSEGFVKLTPGEFREAISTGARWCVKQGYGWEKDLEMIEESGCMEGADESKVSDRAVKRGLNQIGTLGSGNHYLEIQVVKEENIHDKEAADKMGIFPNQIVIMFHCGSRGFGHQVATDYLQTFLNVMERKYKIKILDKELACAPFQSQEGQDYFKAMQCGINMSFANRQVILHRIRECFSKVFNRTAEDMGLDMVYDVAHNTAKIEKHEVHGKQKEVLVHRKGATRAFGPGREEVPHKYRSIGQPVIIGGSMETGSYLLVGTEGAMKNTFGTTAHGSGRTMSRTEAKRRFRGEDLQRDMLKKGIYVRSTSMPGLAEEAGGAYKDIDEVIGAIHEAGISKRVVKLIPIGNVKG